jgi:hypothetical protein
MIKKLTLQVVFFLCLNNLAMAQTGITISGKATLNSEPLINWPIYLLKGKDSTLIKSVISKQNSSFLFENIKDGSYLIAIQSVTSKNKLYIPVKVSNQNLNLNTLNFVGKEQTLKEIKVVSNKSYLSNKNGRTVIELENSPFGLGSTGFEILQSLPGIRLRNDNEISINGKNNIALYIDDRPSNLTGENLIDYIKNLNTGNIEKIEILDVLSAKYDAANNGGIINIKLKKGKNIGSNGTVNLGGGLGLNYRYNSGINYNIRTKKSNLFLNYDFNRIKALDQLNLNRLVSTSNTNFDIENKDVKTRTNNTLLIGYDYSIDSLQSVGILLNTFTNNFISDENNISDISNNKLKDSTINSTSFEKREIYNVSGNINYKKKFANSLSTLSSDLDFLLYDRQSDENLNSNYTNDNGQTYKRPLIFNNQTPSSIKILTGKLDYYTVLKKDTELSFGAKASFVNTISDRKISISSGREYILNPNAKFNYTEHVYAGYLSFKHKLSNKSNIELGLRGEQTIANGDTSILKRIIERDYFNLFPSLTYQNTINPNHTLNFSIIRGINRPKYEELNPFYYFLDEFTFRQGNPQLNPSYLYATKLEWLFKENYSTAIRYNYNQNFFFNIYEQDEVSKNATTFLQNFNYRQTLSLSFNIPVKVAKWYNLNLYTEGSLDFFKYTNKQAQFVYNQSGNYAFILNNDLRLPKKIRASINFNYESPTAFGIYHFKSLYYANMAFSKPVLKNKGSIRLIITDPFDTNATRYATQVFNLDLSGREKAETRSIRLNFSYKFGKTSVKNYERRKLGSEDEKSRVGL